MTGTKYLNEILMLHEGHVTNSKVQMDGVVWLTDWNRNKEICQRSLLLLSLLDY